MGAGQARHPGDQSCCRRSDHLPVAAGRVDLQQPGVLKHDPWPGLPLLLLLAASQPVEAGQAQSCTQQSQNSITSSRLAGKKCFKSLTRKTKI